MRWPPAWPRAASRCSRFLDDLARRCRPAAREEFSDLEEFAGRKLNAWDMAYYSERLQESRYKVSQEALRPYFPLPKVLDGLFALTQRLYGISVRERARCQRLASQRALSTICSIKDRRVVAGFFLDPYSRSEKRSGAWMDECVVAKALPSGTALPVAQLVCNFTAPVGAQPSLLTHDEVITLFHEFGHGLHHMLTRVAYPSIAGINGVAWDAVELPSQFMENFVWRAGGAAAHFGARRRPASRCRSTCCSACSARAPSMPRSIRCGKSNSRRFDFELHANFDPTLGANVAETLRRRAAASGGGAGGVLQPDARELRAHLCRAATRPVTTATNGPKCWPPMRSRRSRKPACSTPRRRRGFAIPFSPAAAASMRWTRSSAFAGASPMCGRCSNKPESPRESGRAALLLALLAVKGVAATAYVSDELVLGVYAEQNNQGQRSGHSAFGHQRGDAGA